MQKILVIEDTPDVRELITDTLRFNGFEIVTAADGEAGIQAALTHLPDLILCDVQMPRKNGVQATAAITTAHPGARIIILTTFDYEDYVFEAIKAGDKPDERLSAQAKLRSKQNTFMAVPVVFLMISNHFGGNTTGGYDWIHLAVLIPLGWLAAKFIRRA